MDIVKRLLQKAYREKAFLEELNLLAIVSRTMPPDDPDDPEFWGERMDKACRQLEAGCDAIKSGAILVWDENEMPKGKKDAGK